ncbi:MAG: GUN4 domain-containing protein [Okeania sp. SIO1I7]|nr:GUN4 domain-containing protein [Okeania sp. SIO1I7]
MSGAPVVDVRGEVVAVHGMSDVEVVQNFASLQASLSESQRETFQQALERVENGVQRLTFSWGIPINLFREYRGRAIALGGEQQEVDLQQQLEEERRKREEAERRLRELEAEQQKQIQEAEKQKQVENEIPLVSAQGVDYTKLRDLLAAGNWKEADLETDRVMLKVAGRESEGWLRYEDVENFSCQELGTIDKLWVKYSNGKFGFSVQKQIYQSLGGTNEYDSQVWKAFGDKVGWRKGGEWLSYSDLTFSEKHYTGHIPSTVSKNLLKCRICGFDDFGIGNGFFSRAETCRL